MLGRRRAVLLLALSAAGCDAVFGTGDPGEPVDAGVGPSGWRTVASGLWHTCGIRGDRTLWCWGSNDLGQLGRPIDEHSELSEPRQVGTITTWAQLSTLANTTCATTVDGALYCWGNNHKRQAGGVPDTVIDAPRLVPGNGKWIAVASGVDHTCALDDAGAAWCWGDSTAGQLGLGAATVADVPTKLDHPGGFREIYAGRLSTCGLDDVGTAWCWGSNAQGQLGDRSLMQRRTPVAVDGGHQFSQLAVGWLFACGRTVDGRARCWGDNVRGQVGGPVPMDRTVPGELDQDPYTDLVEIAAGHQHACARRVSGAVVCWGDNSAGQLVTPNVTELRATPATIGGEPRTWAGLGLGWRRTCLIDDAGALWCAGHGGSGALGVAGEGSVRVPTSLGPTRWSTVAAGDQVTCGASTNAGWCWGNNDAGAVGDGGGIDRHVPVAISVTNPNTISASTGVVAITAPDTLVAWGDNGSAQLGMGSTPSIVPMPTTVVTGVVRVDTAAHTCSVDTLGGLSCWGRNVSGEVGVAAPAVVSARTALNTGPWAGVTFIDVALGEEHSCAIDSTRAVRCWGSNQFKQQGVDVGTDHLPQVVGAAGATQLAGGGFHTCELTSTQLVCWGRNQFGQLGDGATNGQSRANALAVPGAWTAVSAGDAHTCGVKDETLWCWGRNQYGQLGDGTLTSRFAPVQLPGDSWKQVSLGATHSCAIRTDETVWCWGSNRRGELGLGTAWRAELRQITN